MLSSGSLSSAAGLFSWAGKGGQNSGAELATASKAELAFPVFSLGCAIPSSTSVCLDMPLSGWETDSQGLAGERAEHVLGHTYFIFFSGTSASDTYLVVFFASAIHSVFPFPFICYVISEENVVEQKYK